MCSKLTIKTPEWHQWHHSLYFYCFLTLNIFHPIFNVSIVDFEQVNVSWVRFLHRKVSMAGWSFGSLKNIFHSVKCLILVGIFTKDHSISCLQNFYSIFVKTLNSWFFLVFFWVFWMGKSGNYSEKCLFQFNLYFRTNFRTNYMIFLLLSSHCICNSEFTF